MRLKVKTRDAPVVKCSRQMSNRTTRSANGATSVSAGRANPICSFVAFAGRTAAAGVAALSPLHYLHTLRGTNWVAPIAGLARSAVRTQCFIWGTRMEMRDADKLIARRIWSWILTRFAPARSLFRNTLHEICAVCVT